MHANLFTPLVLVLLLQLSTLPSTVAISPLDSVTQNVAINATLSNQDLASSQTSFIQTQAPVVELELLWVSCGIDNRGPVASFRVYLDLASDSVEVYFEFVSVNVGWRGVAHGYVDYGARSWGASLDPSGTIRTGVSVHYAENSVTAAGGGFNSVVRVWAEGSGIRVYAGECQYGIRFSSVLPQTVGGSTPTVTTTVTVAPSDGVSVYSVSVAVAVVLIVVGLVVGILLTRRKSVTHRTYPKETRDEEVKEW